MEVQAERKTAEEAALQEAEAKTTNEQLRKEASAKKLVVQIFEDMGPLNTDGMGRTKLESFHTAKAPGKTGLIVKNKDKRESGDGGKRRCSDGGKKMKQKGGRRKKKSLGSEVGLVD